MKRTLATAIVLGLVGSTTACSSAPAEQEAVAVEVQETRSEEGPSAQELFLQGNRALDAAEFEQAAAAYAEAVEADPQRWDAHLNHGIALVHVRKFDAAINAFDQALRQGGEGEPKVYLNLGNAYQERGMYGASIEAYRAGLAVAGRPDVDLLVNLAAGYLFLRRNEDARATYQHAREVAPDDPRALHGLALVMQMEEKYEDALRTYKQVHAMAPDFPLSYFNRGYVLGLLQRYPEAIEALERYRQIDPEGPYLKRAKNLKRNFQEKLDAGR